MPVQNGFMDAPYDISIPCSVFNNSVVSRPIVLGHGIFGTGQGMVQTIPTSKARFADWTYIAGGTDWIGLSDRRDDPTDIAWIGAQHHRLRLEPAEQLPRVPRSAAAGNAQHAGAGKMMKLGLFNRDPAFEISPGVGVFPGPSEEMYYYGISLGGIMGTWFSALTPDIGRAGSTCRRSTSPACCSARPNSPRSSRSSTASASMIRCSSRSSSTSSTSCG